MNTQIKIKKESANTENVILWLNNEYSLYQVAQDAWKRAEYNKRTGVKRSIESRINWAVIITARELPIDKTADGAKVTTIALKTYFQYEALEVIGEYEVAAK